MFCRKSDHCLKARCGGLKYGRDYEVVVILKKSSYSGSRVVASFEIWGMTTFELLKV